MNIIEVLNSLGRAFVSFAWPMLIQSSALIVMMLILDFILRRRVRAVVRYCLWMLVLVKLVLPTSLSLPMSVGYWVGIDKNEMPVVTMAVNVDEETRRAGSIAKYEEMDTPAITKTDLKPAKNDRVEAKDQEIVQTPESQSPIDWRAVIFLVWAVCAIAMGLLVIQRYLFVRGLIRQAEDADGVLLKVFSECCLQMKMTRTPTIKVSPAMVSPAACLLMKPVILVPEFLPTKLSEKELRAVLLHELAHIRRGDLWVNCAQTILQVIYFYNPLLWLANGVIRRIREQAVDETVLVTLSDNAGDYPETLLNVAKLALVRPALSLRLVGVVESKSALAGRIKHMISRPWPKSAKIGGLAMTGIIVLAAILLPMAKGEQKSNNESQMQEKMVGTAQPPMAESKGVLSFRIAAELGEAEKEKYVKQLAAEGPMAGRERQDASQWFETVDGSYGRIVQEYEGKKYMLLSNQSGETMLPGTWGLKSVSAMKDAEGRPAISFEFDDAGAKLFAEITHASIGKPLAILIGDKVVSAPEVRTALTRRGIIVGKYTQAEVDRMVEELKTRKVGSAQGMKADVGIERTLYGPQYGRESMIDFESGKLFVMPTDLGEDVEKVKRWLAERGIDSVANTGKDVRGLVGYDIVALPIPDRFWVEHFDYESIKSATLGFPVFIIGKDSLPTTYLFMTREGGIGILQILEVQNKIAPTYVKIRYKMIEPGKTPTTQEAKSTDEKEKMVGGAQPTTTTTTANANWAWDVCFEMKEYPSLSTDQLFQSMKADALDKKWNYQGGSFYAFTLRNPAPARESSQTYKQSLPVNDKQNTLLFDSKACFAYFSGWDEEKISMEATVFIRSTTTREEAEAFAKKIQIELKSDGPNVRLGDLYQTFQSENIASAGVIYKVNIPRRFNIDARNIKGKFLAENINGGINFNGSGHVIVDDVKGKINIENNGGWSLFANIAGKQDITFNGNGSLALLNVSVPVKVILVKGGLFLDLRQAVPENLRAIIDDGHANIVLDNDTPLNGSIKASGGIIRHLPNGDIKPLSEASAKFGSDRMGMNIEVYNGNVTLWDEPKTGKVGGAHPTAEKATPPQRVMEQIERMSQPSLPKTAENVGDTKEKTVGTTQPATAPASAVNDEIKVYPVNKRVNEFSEKEDFSTPENAYAAINRVSAAGDPAGWEKASVKELAEKLAVEKAHGKMDVPAEWAKVLRNAEILEVCIWNNEAVVMAKLLQQYSTQEIRKPIDVRHLRLENGRWLNVGNDRVDTLEEGELKFKRRINDLAKKSTGTTQPTPLKHDTTSKSSAEPSMIPAGGVSLFDGVSLKGWESVSPWRVADGAIECPNDGAINNLMCSHIITGPFELSFEMQLLRVHPGDAKGIWFRQTDGTQIAVVRLDDQQDTFHIRANEKVTTNVPMQTETWYEVKCRIDPAEKITAWIYDSNKIETTCEAKFPMTFGLTCERSGAKFRNIVLKDLKSANEVQAKPVVMKGLQLRLEADEAVWAVKDYPSLKLNVKNAGPDTKTVKRTMNGYQLLFDGEEYRYAAAFSGSDVTLKAGDKIDNVHIVLGRSWRSESENKPLTMSIGKHTVLVVPMDEDDSSAKSNPVEVEITDKLQPKQAKTRPGSRNVQPEVNSDDKTIYPGVGLQHVHPGDSSSDIRRWLGEPSSQRTFSNGGLSMIYDQRAMDLFLRNDVLVEMHFNRGYQGSTPQGVRLDSSLDEVLKACGGAQKTIEGGREKRRGAPDGADRVLYKIMDGNGGRLSAYRFYDEKHGMLYWFDPSGQISQIVVYKPQKVAVEEPPVPMTYIIKFKAADEPSATTADDLLRIFNSQPPEQARTHHFRTEIVDNELFGLICADVINGSDTLKKELRLNKKIIVVNIRPAADRWLKKLYVMDQVSLKPNQLKNVSSTSAPATQPETSTKDVNRKYAAQASQEAVRASMAWLKMIDKGQYESSWTQSADYFRQVISQKQWIETIRAVREPFGKVLSRKVISKEYKTSLPGAPDGEYVVIQFQTSFENKKDSVETITPMKDKNGEWRVSGYYIK